MIIGELNKPDIFPSYFKAVYHTVYTIGGSGLYNNFTDSNYGTILSCDDYSISNMDAGSCNMSLNSGDYVCIFDTKNKITGNANTIRTFSAILYNRSTSPIDNIDIYIGILKYHTGDSIIKIHSINKVTLNNVPSGHYHFITQPSIDVNTTGNWYVNPNDGNDYFIAIWLPKSDLGVLMNTNMNDFASPTLYNFPSMTQILEADILNKIKLDYSYSISDVCYFNLDTNPNIAMECYDLYYKEKSNWVDFQIGVGLGFDTVENFTITADDAGNVGIGYANDIIQTSPDYYTIIDYGAGVDGYGKIKYNINSNIPVLNSISFNLIGTISTLPKLNIYVITNGVKKYIDSVEISDNYLDIDGNIITNACHFELYIGEENVSAIIIETSGDNITENGEYHINNFQIHYYDSLDNFTDKIYLTDSDFENNKIFTVLYDNNLYANNNDVVIKLIGYNTNNDIIGQSLPMSNRNR